MVLKTTQNKCSFIHLKNKTKQDKKTKQKHKTKQNKTKRQNKNTKQNKTRQNHKTKQDKKTKQKQKHKTKQNIPSTRPTPIVELTAEASRLTARACVDGLGEGAYVKELTDIFELYGRIQHVWIDYHQPGQAYVFFQDEDDARNAVKSLDRRLG